MQKNDLPDVIYAEPIGYNQGEYYLLPESNRSEKYHHSRIVEALRRENEELKAKLDKARDALEQISRMSPLPDHKSNTMTLVACREIASVALGNKSIVHALRKHKAMNSIYPDAREQR